MKNKKSKSKNKIKQSNIPEKKSMALDIQSKNKKNDLLIPNGFEKKFEKINGGKRKGKTKNQKEKQKM